MSLKLPRRLDLAGVFDQPPFFAVTGLLLALSVAFVVAAARATERPEGSPLGVPPEWKSALAAAVALAFVCYVVGALLTGKFEGSGRLAAVAVAVAVQAAPLAGPLLLSTDAYNYWAYGRVGAIHDENPFRVAPARFPDDPAVQRMGADWRESPMGYGPAFGPVVEAGAQAAGDSPFRGALFHRALAAAAMIAIVLLVARAAPQSALGVVLVGWNPLLALHAAGGGHNDFPMMALAALGYVLVLSGRHAAGGSAWALAIGIKFSAGLLLPFLVLQKRLWRSRGFLAGLGLTLTAVALLATALYGRYWLDAFGGLSGLRRTDGSFGFAPLLRELGISFRVLTVVLVAGAAWLAFQAFRGLPRLSRAGELIVITQSWLNPWYASLYMPFVGLERDRIAQVIAVVLTGYFLIDVVPI